MERQEITNWMLYDLLKDFKKDVDRRFVEMKDEIYEFKSDVNRRFNEIDKRFEQVDKRFEQLYDLHRTEKKEREKMETKLEKVYESRHKVEYRISNWFIMRNLFWNWWILTFFMIFWYFVIN